MLSPNDVASGNPVSRLEDSLSHLRMDMLAANSIGMAGDMVLAGPVQQSGADMMSAGLGSAYRRTGALRVPQSSS